MSLRARVVNVRTKGDGTIDLVVYRSGSDSGVQTSGASPEAIADAILVDPENTEIQYFDAAHPGERVDALHSVRDALRAAGFDSYPICPHCGQFRIKDGVCGCSLA